ncbi:type 1 glutamine amidotransferase [Desulfocurvus sp. DL9XJH121]
MRIRTLEHVPFEGPGAIARWAGEHGHELHRTRVFAGEPLPESGDADLLVAMGGPMGVRDEGRLPWLRAEQDCLLRAMDAGRAVLGVCLGAQLMARALGAEVEPNPAGREIGWFPVTRSGEGESSVFDGFPRVFPAFHWHGDTFAIPPGAVRLGGSAACANQAFALGDRVAGLQFHLETTRESMDLLITNCADELAPAPFVQTVGQLRRGAAGIAALEPLLDTLLANITKEL